MAYRNGTNIAFHANGTNFPINSDIKYYNLIKAWCNKTDDCFNIVNSHEKNAAVRDTSSKETLKRRLRERLNNSKNMLLIVGETTKLDLDWVPFEIEYAVDLCKIPLIVTYIGYTKISAPKKLSHLWPFALKTRIENESAKAIHIPFRKEAIYDATSQFTYAKYPIGGGLGIYSDDTYKTWDS